MKWVVFPFSRESSWPRNWTRVSCTAGGFFTNWAIRDTYVYTHTHTHTHTHTYIYIYIHTHVYIHIYHIYIWYIYIYIIGIGSFNYSVWEVPQSATCNQEIQWYNSVWGQRPEKQSITGESPRVQRFKIQNLQCSRAETDRWTSSRNKEKKFTLPSPFCFIQVLKKLGDAYPHWWKSLSSVRLFVTTVHGLLHARILEWVAVPLFRVFSQPRDRTLVSRIVGRFFTSWATREAQEYWSGI